MAVIDNTLEVSATEPHLATQVSVHSSFYTSYPFCSMEKLLKFHPSLPVTTVQLKVQDLQEIYRLFHQLWVWPSYPLPRHLTYCHEVVKPHSLALGSLIGEHLSGSSDSNDCRLSSLGGFCMSTFLHNPDTALWEIHRCPASSSANLWVLKGSFYLLWQNFGIIFILLV